ncbi:hypothetical protein TRAPUB_829 [Trametes pubescens]|uniref:Uncharacterized protein n=1 Tax=Trametes pubescens TaxID=154538 RepID=A0A1M2VL46_TRAPU|nr:hypothetical protein TRAPUB_829 [Trametes pubescens]
MTSAVGTQLSITDTSSATPTGVDSGSNFIFVTMPSSMDTCGSATVGWDYIGADYNITLLVSSTVMPDPGDVGSTILSLVIAQDVDAASDSFSWSPVKLPAGRYILRATGPNIAAESKIFTIVNGTDTSCLSGVPAHSPASPSKQMSHVIGTSGTTTQTSSFMPSDTATSSPSPSPTRRSHSGAIAGGILGGIGILAVVIVAAAYLRRRHARPPWTAGERDREKASGARAQHGFEEHSSPVKSQTSIAPLSGKRARLEPNRRPSSGARSTLAAPQHLEVRDLAYVEGETPSHEPSTASPTPPTADSKLEPEADPFGDNLSVPSRTHSYRTSGSTISGVGLLGSPVPSSATSQMYRGRDSAGSVWTYWRSLRGDRESRVLNGTSSGHSLEDLSTMPPLQITEGRTFPDGC